MLLSDKITTIADSLVVDDLTVILSVVVIALAIIASLVNPFVRGIRLPKLPDTADSAEDASDNSEITAEDSKTSSTISEHTEPLTLLITASGNASELERNLPLFLSQDYPDYHVVVVCEKTDSESLDILKRMAADNARLYYTFIPESSRYMSRKKLQITLGVKAAKTEWIILTEPTCRPQSKQWLSAMSQQCTVANHLVMGYVALDNETSGYRRFEHIRTAFYLLRRAQRSGAYRSHMPNVAFRKSDFMREQGFQGSLELERGEYDCLVNKYARQGQTAVELTPESWLLRDAPSNKAWRDAHLYLLASLPSLRHTGSMRLLKLVDRLLPHFSLLCSVAVLVFSLIVGRNIEVGAASLALLLLYIVRAIIARKAVSKFADSLPLLALPFYEYCMVWRALAARLRFRLADKNDFISHKL